MIYAKAQAFKKIQGIILSNENSPIEYAAVVLVPSMIGTVSNEDGEFVLNIPENAKNDSLIVSCLGFKKYVCSTSKINEKVKIVLEQSDVVLNEVIVKWVGYNQLVLDAIAKIKNNYPTFKTLSTVHLNYEVKQNQKYLIFFDGTINILIHDYSNYKKFFSSYLVNTRISAKDNNIAPYFYADYAGNILSELFLTDQDFIKNNEKYEFYSKNLTTINDDVVYEIGFKPKDKQRPFSYVGKIYIDTMNLAIIQLDYTLEKNPKNKNLAYYILDNRIDGTKYITSFLNKTYRVNYLKGSDSKYYINFIDYSCDLNIACKTSNVSDNFQSNCRYTVTHQNIQINQENVSSI